MHYIHILALSSTSRDSEEDIHIGCAREKNDLYLRGMNKRSGYVVVE